LTVLNEPENNDALLEKMSKQDEVFMQKTDIEHNSLPVLSL